MNGITVVISISFGYFKYLFKSLETIPSNIRVVISLYDSDSIPIDLLKIFEERLKEFSNVILVKPIKRVNNFWRSYALNVAIQNVKTKYVLIGDADFVYPEGFFNKICNMKSSLFLVGRMRKTISEEILSGKINSKNCFKKENYDEIIESCNPCLCPVRSIIKIRGLDEKYYGYGFEDNDFIDRLTLSGQIFKRNNIIVGHLWHGGHRKSEYKNYWNQFNKNKKDFENRELKRIVNFEGWGDNCLDYRYIFKLKTNDRRK